MPISGTMNTFFAGLPKQLDEAARELTLQLGAVLEVGERVELADLQLNGLELRRVTDGVPGRRAVASAGPAPRTAKRLKNHWRGFPGRFHAAASFAGSFGRSSVHRRCRCSFSGQRRFKEIFTKQSLPMHIPNAVRF